MHKRFAFTVIELLMVVTIIAVFITITLLAYSNFVSRASSANLQSNLTNNKKLLINYYNTYGSYPNIDPVTLCPTSPTVDNAYCLETSGGVTLNYSSTSSTFSLHATLGSLINKVTESSVGYPLSVGVVCPVGFVAVPGSATYGKSDFCVMKYEARQVGSSTTPVSIPTGNPWVSISQTNAIAYSQNVSGCSGCHLITEAEWMTIAQNVLSNPINWSLGAVGSGYIYSGHNDGSPSTVLSASNDSNGYYGVNNTSGNQRRTLVLTNGEVIWDLSGNIGEWTATSQAGNFPSGMPSAGFYQWNTVSGGTWSSGVSPYPSGTNISGSGAWTSTNGIGTIYGLSSDTSLRGFIRGGDFTDGSNSGILALYLGWGQGGDSRITFRVSK